MTQALCPISAVFSVFLAFFILLTFDCIVNFIAPHSAFVTVLAFLIVVLTYHLRDELDDQSNKMRTEVQSFIQEQQNTVVARKEALGQIPIRETAREVLAKIQAEILKNQSNNNG